MFQYFQQVQKLIAKNYADNISTCMLQDLKSSRVSIGLQNTRALNDIVTERNVHAVI